MVSKQNEKKVGLSTNGAVVIGAIVGAILFFGGGVGLFLLTGLVRFDTAGVELSGLNELEQIIENIDDINSVDKNENTSGARLIDNPSPRVKVNGRLVEVGNLEFYLPYEFTPASSNGKNGVYIYNLTNDDGWADVKVYTAKSSLSPERYLLSLSPTLEITDGNYRMNGTSWVQAENGSMLAYATRFDGEVYAVIYGVKLDSDATAEAMQMLPITLRMKKVYK